MRKNSINLSLSPFNQILLQIDSFKLINLKPLHKFLYYLIFNQLKFAYK